MIGTTFDSPPPDIDDPSAQDLWGLLKAGRRFRSLGSRDSYRLLRWLPMPIGDLMIEWFGNERLRALLAGPGLSGTMLGPRSAGSSLVFLFREACRLRAGGRSLRVRGGPGALTAAIAAAAREAGAEIRTGVSVERILVADERVTGVVAGGQGDFVRDRVVRARSAEHLPLPCRPRRPGAGVRDADTQLSSVGNGGEDQSGAVIAAGVPRRV